MRAKIALSAALMHAVMADTCLSQGELGGVIFGSVFGTLVLCVAVALILWVFLRKTPEKNVAVHEEKTAYVNAVCEMTERGCDAEMAERKSDKFTLIDSYKLKRKADFGQQKSFSTEHVNEVDGKAAVLLKSNDLSGLGFSIYGNMNDGIFVKDVHKNGPARDSRNVFADDKIRSVWISFENIVYEDAVTILSYASPYIVKLELERKMDEELDNTGLPARVHPLLRSNTLKHVHFNSMSGGAPAHASSDSSLQKFELPPSGETARDETLEGDSSLIDGERVYACIETPDRQTPEPTTAPESEKDAQTVDNIVLPKGECPKMSSSDYSSTSDVSSLSPPNSPPKLSAANSIDNRSDSPCSHNDSLEEEPEKEPKESEPLSVDTAVIEKIETVPTRISPIAVLTPTPPQPEKAIALPHRQMKFCQKPPSPSMSLPRKIQPARSSSSPPSQRKSSIPMKKVAITGNTKSRIPPPTARAPDFTEVRISRIPQRREATTPVVERKLPNIPSSSLSRSNTMDKEKDGDIWSRLYQEKKGNLKKTREVRAKSEDPIYGTLKPERRERLTQNDELLAQQVDELRKLGVL